MYFSNGFHVSIFPRAELRQKPRKKYSSAFRQEPDYYQLKKPRTLDFILFRPLGKKQRCKKHDHLSHPLCHQNLLLPKRAHRVLSCSWKHKWFLFGAALCREGFCLHRTKWGIFSSSFYRGFLEVLGGLGEEHCCLSLCCVQDCSDTMKCSPAVYFARPLAEVLLG